MAFATLPKPGSKYGPCETECRHIDCASTRRAAESICPVCQQPIGYDQAYWTVEAFNQHVDCTD